MMENYQHKMLYTNELCRMLYEHQYGVKNQATQCKNVFLCIQKLCDISCCCFDISYTVICNLRLTFVSS